MFVDPRFLDQCRSHLSIRVLSIVVDEKVFDLFIRSVYPLSFKPTTNARSCDTVWRRKHSITQSWMIPRYPPVPNSTEPLDIYLCAIEMYENSVCISHRATYTELNAYLPGPYTSSHCYLMLPPKNSVDNRETTMSFDFPARKDQKTHGIKHSSDNLQGKVLREDTM